MIRVIDLSKEEWKTIKYKNKKTNYEISNYARCRNKINGKIIKHRIDKQGYECVRLYINKKQKNFFIHRLVAMAFIKCEGNFEDYQVNHKNGRKYCNKPHNLEWCNGSENSLHAYKTGLHKSKYSEELVKKICKYLEKGFGNKKIYKKLKVSNKYSYKEIAMLIGYIKSKVCWTWISNDYNIEKPRETLKIKEETVIKICKLISEGKDNNYILSELNSEIELKDPRDLINRIRRKDSFKKISDKYF